MAKIRVPARIRKTLKNKKFILGLFLLPILILFGIFYYYILRDLPSPTRLRSNSLPQSTQIYDRNDTLLYTIYANKNQSFTSISHIPLYLQQATISIEDKDFYRHGAVDFRGIARAFYQTFFNKQLQGGSTLTQQLVKNSLLTQERTWQRKGKELILSVVTEILYSKKSVLEMYLNQVPYGGTAYGVEAASQTYFGKHVQDISIAEAAYLAGLPEAPSVFSPFGTHPELGKERQREVLRKMREQKYITPEQEKTARAEELVFQKVSSNIKAPHFVFYIKNLLSQKYGEEIVETGGLKVKTSLDLSLQEYAQATVSAEITKLKNSNVTNGAALITNPTTGEILAMVGSVDYFEPRYGSVNITLQSLQPGSSIKPINYATGLIKGFSAATPFIDRKMCFGETYCPQNYDGKYRGVVQMRNALGNSLNIPAVKMLKANGVDAMIATASAMGISTFTDIDAYGLSLTLGSGNVYMTDMVTAYGVLANTGYRVDLHPILKVLDKNGRILEEYTPPPSAIFGKKVIPSGVAYIISHILMDNNARLDAFGPNSELKIGTQPVSVKTGTTNDYRDNWTIGYSHGPSYVVAVWVGNNDHSAMRGVVSGVTGAAPIWHDLMTHLLEGQKAQQPKIPGDVIGKYVCTTSGLIPPAEGTPDRCPTKFEYFIKGKEPRQVDPGRVKVFIDKGTNDLAKSGQTDNVEERSEVVVTDVTGEKYCLTCPHPEPSPAGGPTPTP